MYSKKRRQHDYIHPRRSSLQVNLSFTSDLSDASEGSVELKTINSKQESVDEKVKQLREAILNKTREIFDHKNDFCRKTATVLAGPSSSSDQNDQNQSNSQENKKLNNLTDCLPIDTSPIISSSKNNNYKSKSSHVFSPTISTSSNNSKDSTVIGNPITCSTFMTDNDVPKRKIVEATNLPVEPSIRISSKKPTIRSIRSCYISLEKIDGYDRSKNLKQISMELTPVQGKMTSPCNNKDGDLLDNAEAKAKVSIRSSLEVRTSLDQLSNQSSALNSSTTSQSLLPHREESKNIVETARGGSRLSLRVNTSRVSNSNSMNSSIVTATPCPISRSTLLRRFPIAIEQKTSINSVRSVKKLAQTIDLESAGPSSLKELDDTIILDASCSVTGPIIQDSSDESEKNYVDNNTFKNLIRESSNSDDEMSDIESSSLSPIKKKTIKQKRKRKLFTQLNDSGLISLSPLEHVVPSPPKPTEELIKERIQETRKKRRRSKTILLKKKPDDKKNEEKSETQKCKVRFPKALDDKEKEKAKQPLKKRKIISKKIVVKKRVNPDVLKFLTQAEEADTGRDSLNDFTDSKRLITKARHHNKSIYIVTTGLCNGDKDLVKEAVKKIGGAKIEGSVTRNTTHIITTGVRTINLLRGIIRGCWLLRLAWIKDSMRAQHWLESEPYEIPHFSKAVKENRKDREIFGRSYVPELFATCGLIYVDASTSPPRDILKELIKTAGGRIIEHMDKAKIIVGGEHGIREVWVLDSITTGHLQSINQYV